ncbi:SUR7 family protein FMP45 [Nakaseomyces bracarensis]|uniref:SUR7 family protein FMP45 n=1 Tax=Nakaseomyces bracarensis TaxID=273131 RepID=A0ABR4NN51_9SACH
MQYKKFVNAIVTLFIMGAGVMSFFLILSGARDGGTLKNFYWFEANTDGFNDAPTVTRWYNYMYCGYQDGHTYDCSSRGADKPFSPKDNFGESDNMPRTFIDKRKTYYYLSKVGWAMLLISLFFTVIAIIPVFMSVFLQKKAMSVVSCTFCWISWFFITLAACLYTGCYAKAKKAFHHDNRHAKMGVKCFALLWTTVFLMMICSIWTLVDAITHKKYEQKYRTNEVYTETEVVSPVVPEVEPQHTRRTFFTKLRTKKKVYPAPAADVADFESNEKTDVDQSS